MKKSLISILAASFVSFSCSHPAKTLEPAIRLPPGEPNRPLEQIPIKSIAVTAAERAKEIFRLNKTYANQKDLLDAFELSQKIEKKIAKKSDFYELLETASVDIRNEVLRDYFRFECNRGQTRSSSVAGLRRQGQLQPSLQEKLTGMHLSSDDALNHFAKKALRDRCFNSSRVDTVQKARGSTLADRFKQHDAAADPLFKSTLKVACDRDGEDAWYRWADRSQLDLYQSYFFKSKLAGCRARLEAATRFGEKLMKLSAKSLWHSGLQVEIGRRLVKWMRSTRSRVVLSAMYEQLVRRWDRPGLLALHVGMKDRKFAEERENMRIWSARYLALIGHYQKALVAVTIARQNLNFARKSGKGNDKALVELLAESFHVEAFRILVERQQYAQAAKLYKFAVEEHDFSSRWKSKFWWYSGLFSHLSGKHVEALGHWAKIAAVDPKETYKTKVLFWTMKAHLAIGQKAQSKIAWEKLRLESAIGYYTLVAGRKLAQKHGWNDQVISSLSTEKSPYSVREGAQRLLVESIGQGQWDRFLLATNIGPSKWTRLVGFEVLEKLKGGRKLLKNNDLSRDFFGVLSSTGLHYKHIYMQTLLSNQVDDFWRRYPRQFSIYFPAPYRQRIAHAAKGTVDPNLILGLIRQESSFRETVGSGAGAYGLMQITPSTARGLEPAWKQKPETFVQSKLKQADSNLRLGIKNLRNLTKKYAKHGELTVPAVLSAYNAGEEVTDRWMRYRKAKDADAWVEMVPFGETQKYIKFVQRNQAALKLLEKSSSKAQTAY